MDDIALSLHSFVQSWIRGYLPLQWEGPIGAFKSTLPVTNFLFSSSRVQICIHLTWLSFIMFQALCDRPDTQKCKVMAPAFNELTAKRQTYTTLMIRLAWMWLKFCGVLEMGEWERLQIWGMVSRGRSLWPYTEECIKSQLDRARCSRFSKQKIMWRPEVWESLA